VAALLELGDSLETHPWLIVIQEKEQTGTGVAARSRNSVGGDQAVLNSYSIWPSHSPRIQASVAPTAAPSSLFPSRTQPSPYQRPAFLRAREQGCGS